MHEEGEEIEVELVRVTESGRGVAIAKDGKIVIIDDVEEDDININIEITKVLEQTYFAKKTGNSKSKLSSAKKQGKPGKGKDNPYEMDGDGQVEEDDDDSALFDDDEEEDEEE